MPDPRSAPAPWRLRPRYRVRATREVAPRGVASAPRLAVVVSPRGQVAALTLRSGRIAWTHRLRARPSGPPSVHQDRVLVGDRRGHLVALHVTSGKVLWRARLGAAPSTRAVSAGNGTVFVGTAGGRVLALALTSGAARWRARFRRPIIGLAPLPDGDLIVAARDRSVRRLRGADGAEQWRRDLPGSAHLPPVTDGARVYVLDATGRLLALGARDGSPIWRQEGFAFRPLGLSRAPSGALLVTTRDGLLHCLRAADGRPRWIKPLGARWATPPRPAGATSVWVATAEPRLLAVRLDSGGHYLSHPLPAPPAAPPMPAGGRVVQVLRDGRVLGLDVSRAPAAR